jgi:hypothetical protein
MRSGNSRNNLQQTHIRKAYRAVVLFVVSSKLCERKMKVQIPRTTRNEMKRVGSELQNEP